MVDPPFSSGQKTPNNNNKDKIKRTNNINVLSHRIDLIMFLANFYECFTQVIVLNGGIV